MAGSSLSHTGVLVVIIVLHAGLRENKFMLEIIAYYPRPAFSESPLVILLLLGLRENRLTLEFIAYHHDPVFSESPPLLHCAGHTSALTADLSTCGSPVVTTRIVGGTDAVDGEWPWQVSVHYQGSHICGGSLISTQWVLSAAHCFENSVSAADYQVYLGFHRLWVKPPPQAVISGVHTLIVSAEYNGTGSRGDIALLRLSAPISPSPYILPVCLPSASVTFPCGLECWVTGWGHTAFHGDRPSNGTLQKVRTPLIDHETCDTLYHIWSLDYSTIIQEDKICAGFVKGQKDSCQGDSGGPLVCKVDGVWYQAGIVSWGEGCAYPFRPGVYTLVPAYEQWIRTFVDVNFTDVTDMADPPLPCADGLDNIESLESKGNIGGEHHGWTPLVLLLLLWRCL
ncbi:serine protease 27-like [Bufo bufo]|uniref:serine protease 27-like n=1 Tax=Bufo bufo TaxID=8384 RepID=UPI001ABE9618|nr:serine protease 27-like [Bufo bufo]